MCASWPLAGRVKRTRGGGSDRQTGDVMTARGLLRSLAALTAAGALGAFYATVVERQWFALRRVRVPVLPAGAAPVTVLHLSDLHMVPGQRRKQRWVAGLARLEPDLVVMTGDTLSSADAVAPSLAAFGPLLDLPGVFVFGNNDFYAPEPKSPHRYFTRRTRVRREVDLPWPDLRDELVGRGWADVNNARALVTIGGASEGGRGAAGGTAEDTAQGSVQSAVQGSVQGSAGVRRVAVAGVNDPHTGRDKYGLIAGPADDAAVVRLGVTHSPEPRLLDKFAADGYDLVLAGHTHGGQVRLPLVGALVTNCGIDRSRARGVSRWGARMWLNVSAGLGASPYMPVRFCCRPEATLLTLVSRPG